MNPANPLQKFFRQPKIYVTLPSKGLFYAKEADEMRFVVEFKMGVQVAFTDQIVFWKKYVAP